MTVAAAQKSLAPPREFRFDAYVSGTGFEPRSGTFGFALGDGTLRIVGTEATTFQVHKGAALSFAVDARNGGFLTGGDDGRLCRTMPDGTVTELLALKGRWIERLAAHPTTGMIAAPVGKEIHLLGGAEPLRLGPCPSTVSDVAFSPDGSRVAGAHYGGVTIWNLQQPASPPRKLPWKGSHLYLSYAPGGRYLASSMQEAALHCWRLADGSDMQMSGYPAKVKSLAWTPDAKFLVSSGAPGFVCWPFVGKGPQGKPPVEFSGRKEEVMVTVVAGHPKASMIAAGYADGVVEVGDPEQKKILPLAKALAGTVSALGWSPDGRYLAAGTETGEASIYDLQLR